MASVCARTQIQSISATRRLSAARKALPVRPGFATSQPTPRLGARLVVRAEADDFDAVLAKLADKFEKSDNKPAIVAWSAAATLAFFFSEWFIHLPLLDILIGFPVQLVGLVMLPYLGVRYFKDGKSVTEDLGAITSPVIALLPGLEKK